MKINNLYMNNIIQKLTTDFLILNKFEPHIQVPILASNKAKNISIKIDHNGVKLILPNRNKLTIKDAGYKFLLDKELWIRKKLQNLLIQDTINHHSIPIFDEIYSLDNIESPYNKIQINQNTIQIYSKHNQYRNILIKFLKSILLSEISKLASIFREKYNLNYTKIKLLDNKSKWGSCNSRAELSFNWRLVFAPKNILEYLIVHEICHIAEMNHSKNFWSLVAKLYPDYKTAKLWLKRNGYRLSQYLTSEK
jgi:predicted metal-dependent hydrolase